MAAKNKQKSKARILKDIFTQLIPVIQKQGFVEKPFVNSEFGWHPGIGYMYAFARMDGKSERLAGNPVSAEQSNEKRCNAPQERMLEMPEVSKITLIH